MLVFYRKAALGFLALAILTLALTYLGVQHVFLRDALQPAADSVIPWDLEIITDNYTGGSSSISVKEQGYSLEYEYQLSDDILFPYVIAVLKFAEPPNLVDLGLYSSATFRVKCTPHNVLALHLHSFDVRVTDPNDFSTYRVAAKYFSCGPQWEEIDIDLRHLNIPVWWLETYEQDVSDKNYWPEKTLAISIDNSNKGPVNELAKVTISELTLHGYNWRYAWILVGILALLWAGFTIWVLRLYTSSLVADLKEKLKKNRPLIAYQQLSIEPHKDEEKSRLLRFMATEYANPDMSLEFAIATLGINRTKINDLLKHELGLTFSAYLNKQRLAEAARLLSVQDDPNVADIAYSVGYNNVSYFNKLFKGEYGCTPKTFKSIYEANKAD